MHVHCPDVADFEAHYINLGLYIIIKDLYGCFNIISHHMDVFFFLLLFLFCRHLFRGSPSRLFGLCCHFLTMLDTLLLSARFNSSSYIIPPLPFICNILIKSESCFKSVQFTLIPRFNRFLLLLPLARPIHFIDYLNSFLDEVMNIFL